MCAALHAYWLSDIGQGSDYPQLLYGPSARGESLSAGSRSEVVLPTESGGSFAHGRRPVGQVPDLAAFLQRGGSNSAVQASAPLAWSSGFLHTWSERGLESHESFSPALYMAIGCTASLGRAPDAVRFCGFPCCRPSAHAAAGASPLTHQAMYQSCVRGAPLRLQLRWQSSYWGRSYCHRGRTTRAVPLIPT